MYFHFTGLSYILTLCVYTFSFSFILVNYMAKDFFLWKYEDSNTVLLGLSNRRTNRQTDRNIVDKQSDRHSDRHSRRQAD